VLEGARQAGKKVTIAEVWGAGKDHPTRKGFPEGHYLKVLKVIVGEIDK
jgi:23S rRNA G2069 N7-methylase RlmK/C1962 C5-methylase RlmI